MIKITFLLSVILFTASAVTRIENLESYTFEQFVEEYEKGYGFFESLGHEKTFYENLAFIIDHNKLNDGLTLGVNKFADLTPEEMKKYKGHVKKTREQTSQSFLEKSTFAAPSSLDWRKTKGVLSATKDQEQCGSCWAFSATESIESAIAIKSGQTAQVLAPQELVDCTPNPYSCGGTGGCEGATAQLGFAYAIGAGMASEDSYPYKGRDQTCEMSSKTAVAHISSYVNVTSNDRDSLIAAVQIGPVSISIDAGSLYFQLYYSGVFSKCSKDAVIDHAVQLAGYDMTDSDNAYWIVRNSWGGSWGEGGYVNMKMYPNQPSGDSNCGTDSKPLDGSGCTGGPSSVKVCGECGILYDNAYPVV